MAPPRLTEFRVVWQECPHNHHPKRVLFVEAASRDDAKALARDHVERRFGIEWFTIHEITTAPPMPSGKVRS
jgi:hypothetical protein